MKFRMVDRILSWEPDRRIRGVKTVSFEEYSARTSLRGPAQLPETLALAGLVELGRWLLILSSDFTRTGTTAELGRTRFERGLAPGERMIMDVTAHPCDDGVTFEGTGRSRTGVVVACESCRLAVRPLPECCNPDDLRVLFSEIHRPDGGFFA